MAARKIMTRPQANRNRRYNLVAVCTSAFFCICIIRWLSGTKAPSHTEPDVSTISEKPSIVSTISEKPTVVSTISEKVSTTSEKPTMVSTPKLVLITGVAGYIGSHTALKLLEDGWHVVGIDNMSRGSQKAVDTLLKFENFQFEHADLGNKHDIGEVFQKHTFPTTVSAVLHLASFSFVKESIQHPMLYKRNIEVNTATLMNSMIEHNVSNLVFASSCAVYGDAEDFPMKEDTPTQPISPYGKSKLVAETNILSRVSSSIQRMDSKPIFRARILRYFNVIGADGTGRLGENPRPDLSRFGRLWTSCMEVVRGRSRCVAIGKDKMYHRDFVHVEDVARANVAALQHIIHAASNPANQQNQQENVEIWNVATNKATSLKTFVATAQSVAGVDIPICKDDTELSPDDESLAPFVQGSAERLTLATGWKPQYLNLTQKLMTAWNYNKRARQKETAIVMYDTRSLDVPVNSSNVYWRWTAELNFYYARRHDYDFIYIHGVGNEDSGSSSERGVRKAEAQCTLDMPSKNLSVPRGVSWCKLLGLASVFERGYSSVVLADSDVFFQTDAPSLDTLVREHGIMGKSKLSPLVWFPVNDPYGHDRPNAALQIWQTTSSAAWRLLRHWWQLNKSPKSHSFEQDSLWEIVGIGSQDKMETCGVGLLDLPHMLVDKRNELPVVHVASGVKNSRERIVLPEFEKIYKGSSEIHSKVLELNSAESIRLQRLLASESDNVAC